MPLVRVENLRKTFQRRGGAAVHATNGVSFTIEAGETLGLIGESGSGKSTVGRMVLGLIAPTEGTVDFDGRDLARLTARQLRELRSELQVIFQEPLESLNPRMRVSAIVEEPLVIHRRELSPAQRRARVLETLALVGLDEGHASRFPGEISGGQQQRVGIARAIITEPRFIVLDEPTSSLDLSVRASVLELLGKLQRELNLSYLFISHDLATVRFFCMHTAVMYLGRIVELTDKVSLFEMPLHPYTEALLSAVPIPKGGVRGRRRIILKGEVPSPINPPVGCHFHPRCAYAMKRCRNEEPTLREVMAGHWAACHLHDRGAAFPLAKPTSL